MSLQKSATRGVAVDLQAAGATTGNGNAIAIPPSFNKHTVTLITSAGISAGKVIVETADSPTYAGTWNPEATEVVLAASKEVVIAFEGIRKFIRARISTNVVGGTLQATYLGGS